MKSVAGIMGNNNKPKLNKNDVVSDTSKMSLHDKMKNRILIKKLKEAEKQLVEDNRIKESLKNYVPYDFGEDDKKVFKIAGEEGKQETSAVIRSDLETNDSKTKVKSINKKKKSKSKK
jgi:UDP-N-acetylmuramyl tripeptide synthase